MSLTAWYPPASLTPDQYTSLNNRSVSFQRSSPVVCWARTCTFHRHTRGSQSEDCSKTIQKPSCSTDFVCRSLLSDPSALTICGISHSHGDPRSAPFFRSQESCRQVRTTVHAIYRYTTNLQIAWTHITGYVLLYFIVLTLKAWIAVALVEALTSTKKTSQIQHEHSCIYNFFNFNLDFMGLLIMFRSI